MMDVILYLYKTSRKLVAMGMPMSVLKAEGIFDKVIAIKYEMHSAAKIQDESLWRSQGSASDHQGVRLHRSVLQFP